MITIKPTFAGDFPMYDPDPIQFMMTLDKLGYQYWVILNDNEEFVFTFVDHVDEVTVRLILDKI